MSEPMEFSRNAAYLFVIIAVLYLTVGVLGTLGYVDLSELVASFIGFLIVLLGVYLVANIIISFVRQESP